jgi:hypothetical protein
MASMCKTQHTEKDKHHCHEEFHRQSDPRWDYDVEEENRAAHDEEGRGVTQTPKHPNATGAIDAPLAADDGRHGYDVIGIRGVAHAEKEPEERHREKLRHVTGAPA